MVTFIVSGNQDEALSSSSNHGVASTVIKEMKCGSPQHEWRYYCRCTAEDSDFESIISWYEETFNHCANLPLGSITVIENHNGIFDTFHYFNEVYDE